MRLFPSRLGVGRLVRAHSISIEQAKGLTIGQEVGDLLSQNEHRAVMIDTVMSDNVSRIICDTHRTDGTLALNEVRIRVFFAVKDSKTSDETPSVRSLISESVYTMKGRHNSIDNDRIDEALSNTVPMKF